MKKSVKRIFSIVLVLCICLLLCSCRELDDMKANRAVFTDQTYSEILFDGSTYKFVANWPDSADITYYNSTMVCEKDVPLLLSEFFGKTAVFDPEKKVICLEYDKYYCREDIYDSVINGSLNNLNTVCFSVYDEEEGYHKNFKVDAEIAQAIEAVLSGNPTITNNSELQSAIYLYKTDESMLVLQDYVYIAQGTDKNIYIVAYYETDYKYYLVPDSMYRLFSTFLNENSDAKW